MFLLFFFFDISFVLFLFCYFLLLVSESAIYMASIYFLLTLFLLLLQKPEFDWSPETIGVVDSSFFWGYLVTQIPGGFLATRYPANR